MATDNDTTMSAKKSKKHKRDTTTPTADGDDNDTADNGKQQGDVSSISLIAKPLADSKQTKKIYKLIKKVTKAKQLRRGVKEVIKALKKNQSGILILAGNISPIDVISHLPVLAEKHSIPYMFVPFKEELGIASATKRPTSTVLIQKPADLKASDYGELYTEVHEMISGAAIKYKD